jgi:endothelin-converting enzyme/putative endopeptidase
VNYGGVGAIVVMKFLMVLIGARYNADENLVDWWTSGDLEQFTILGTSLGSI